jgi:DNA-binding response OmpR family regulator
MNALFSHRFTSPLMRIVLVENHPDTLQYVGRFLRVCGHEVATARTVAEARLVLADQACDLLLSDLSLPDGDGWELLESLGEARPRWAIAMSGKNSPADRAHSLAAGFQGHLGKPFLPSELERVLRELEPSE